MKLTYEMIFSILKSKFNLVKGEKKDYFLDDSQRIVATVDKNLITMFYDFPENSRKIWNHHGKVAIAFAKNFNVNGKICDILCVDGLCGAYNDFILNENFAIDMWNNTEMRYLLENEESLQNQFDTLSYEERISILENVKGAKFTGASIKGIQLFKSSDKYALGNCGCLSANYGLASFDICGVIKVSTVVVNNQENGYDINTMDVKGNQEIDYEEVYKYYREKNDLYFDKDKGYNTRGSYETREFTEWRKYSTVDRDSIHMRKTKIQPIGIGLDKIYEKGDQSLNAKRLQMIYTLNLLLNDKEKSTDYVSSHYNFNVRNCDLMRKRIKR